MYADIDQDGPAFAEAQYLGDPQSGTFNMGDGVSTQQLQNPNVSIRENRRIAGGHPWMQSLGVALVVILILIGLEALLRKGGENGARVRIGLENLLYITAMAAVGFYMLKTGVGVWKGAPGALKQFVGAI
jgi:hypothetical protein